MCSIGSIKCSDAPAQRMSTERQAARLRRRTESGIMLTGVSGELRYVANETPGTKQAKLQLLEQLGWKCYSVTWADR